MHTEDLFWLGDCWVRSQPGQICRSVDPVNLVKCTSYSDGSDSWKVKYVLSLTTPHGRYGLSNIDKSSPHSINKAHADGRCATVDALDFTSKSDATLGLLILQLYLGPKLFVDMSETEVPIGESLPPTCVENDRTKQEPRQYMVNHIKVRVNRRINIRHSASMIQNCLSGYKYPHYNYETLTKPSYLNNENSYTDATSLYWEGPMDNWLHSIEYPRYMLLSARCQFTMGCNYVFLSKMNSFST